MKLRIRGNSVRFRLLRSEVAALGAEGRIAETTIFGSTEKDVLTYSIQISDDAERVSAGFCENDICVVLPREAADEWINSEQVEIEAAIEENGQTIEILVEKDFVCLTRTDDPDNRDAFPIPKADC